MSYAAAFVLTMVFGVVVYSITDSHLMAGVTGLVGGVAYARASRESR